MSPTTLLIRISVKNQNNLVVWYDESNVTNNVTNNKQLGGMVMMSPNVTNNVTNNKQLGGMVMMSPNVTNNVTNNKQLAVWSGPR